MDPIQQAAQLGLELRTEHVPVIVPVTVLDTEDTTFTLYVYAATRTARLVGVSFVCGDALPAGEDFVEFELRVVSPNTLLAAWSSEEGISGETVTTVDVGSDGVVINEGAILRLDIVKSGNGVILPPTTVFLRVRPDIPS